MMFSAAVYVSGRETRRFTTCPQPKRWQALAQLCGAFFLAGKIAGRWGAAPGLLPQEERDGVAL